MSDDDEEVDVFKQECKTEVSIPIIYLSFNSNLIYIIITGSLY